MDRHDRTPGPSLTRRWPRRVLVGSATVAGLAVVTTTAGGWYYADELLQVRPDPPEYPVHVVDVDGTSITLSGAGAAQPGVQGIAWPGGYARVGPDIRSLNGRAAADPGGEPDGGVVVRSLRPYPDTPPAGVHVRMDFYAAPPDAGDLATATGLDVRTVTYDGPLGRYPATFVPGAAPTGSRWVVHVHGRGGTRSEAYRLVPVMHGLGMNQLAISYRNDDGAPRDPDGEFGLGWTESEDLAAAVREARTRGADDVVLVGYSMGGAIVGNYLRTHGSAGIAGVVYDAPALSWPDILAFQAADRGLPGFAGRIASTMVKMRTGIDLGVMDQVAHAERLDVPVLLAHGENDATVPVASSDEFAAARPGLVTYLRTGGEHVQSWNVGPDRYEAALRAFLRRLS